MGGFDSEGEYHDSSDLDEEYKWINKQGGGNSGTSWVDEENKKVRNHVIKSSSIVIVGAIIGASLGPVGMVLGGVGGFFAQKKINKPSKELRDFVEGNR